MIVLASGSASRRAMLDAAGIRFRVLPAAIDERAIEREAGAASSAEIAVMLAQAKCLAVAGDSDLVLGSDSLVEVNGRRFDKPSSRAEAAEHLRFFSGQKMALHAAAALARNGEVVWRHGAVAHLQVRDLSETFLAAYLDVEWPAVGQCVGVFRIEGPGVQLFERIDGDHFTILGMPLLQVLSALRAQGELPQ